MSVVKVLIVDDSPVIREKISTMLSEDPEIEVLGIADGKENAMEKIAALRPDVITLNLKSKQNSNTFLKEVSAQSSLPVVVITETAIDSIGVVKAGTVDFVKMPLIRTGSTMSEFTNRLAQHIKETAKKGAKTAAVSPAVPATPKTNTSGFSAKLREESTVKANVPAAAVPKAKAPEPDVKKPEPAVKENTLVFSAKPKDIPTPVINTAPRAKPEQIPERPSAPRPELTTQLRPDSARVELSSEAARSEDSVSPTAKALAAATAARQRLVPTATPKGRRHVIALGASTGGTDALQTVLQDLPVNTPGIVIVQHMPEMFTKMYADRLDRVCKMTCVEARDGERVEVGKIILAAGNFHLRLAKDAKGYYVTSQHGEKVSGHCPSVDVLFESVATVAGKDAIGAIFTGMGADGAIGLKKMRDSGAFTIGQDKETCVVYGMPMVAYNMGGVCLQAPLEKIPQIILENC